MITGFYFYLTAFITVFLMAWSVFHLAGMLAFSLVSQETVVRCFGLLAIFSASTVFFIWGLIL
jgi:hypothetical protein